MPNPDLCNPLAVWQALIELLAGPPPNSRPAPTAPVNGSLRPPLLREPEYTIEADRVAGKFQLRKPNFEIYDNAITPATPSTLIQEFPSQAEAETFRRTLPRVRLPGRLQNQFADNGSVSTLSPSRRADWRSEPDAADSLRRLTDVFAHMPVVAGLPDGTKVALNLAILPPDEVARFVSEASTPVVHIDLFKPRGILGVAAAYIHELTHAEYFFRRGFPVHELPHLLTREEYVLVTVDEELACFMNEVKAVEEFVSSVPAAVRPAFVKDIDVAIEAPAALYFSSAVSGATRAQVDRLTREIVGEAYALGAEDEYARIVAASGTPSAAASAWVSSREWTTIKATRPAWIDAGVLTP